MRPLLRAAILALLCLPAVAADAAAPKPGQPMPIDPVRLNLDIDEHGKVLAVECDPAMVAAVCAAVSKAVPRWVFVPASDNGAAVRLWSGLMLEMYGEPIETGYALRAVKAHVSPGRSKFPQRQPPAFPREQEHRGESGTVELELLRQPDGKTGIGRAWLNAKPTGTHNAFVRASILAAERWEMDWDEHDKSSCSVFNFVFDRRTIPSAEPDLCEPTYVEGFKSAVLQTKPETMSF